VDVTVFGPAVQAEAAGASSTTPPMSPPGSPSAPATNLSNPSTQPAWVGAPKQTARRAESVASYVEVTMWVFLVLSVVGGSFIGFQRDSDCDFSDCSFSETYPLLGLGLGVAIAGVVQCLMVIMIATYIRARADGSIR
jgi:hypothetical protein